MISSEHDFNGVICGMPLSHRVAANIGRIHTELCYVPPRAGEHIMISSYPPYIQMLSSFGHSNQIRPIYITRNRFSDAMRSNSCRDRLLERVFDKAITSWKFLVQKFVMSIDMQSAGRGGAAIYPARTYSPKYMAVRYVSMRYPTACPVMDVGAQLRLGGFFRSSYQIASSDPQKDSGESKKNCERCDDRFSIVMGEMPQTNTIDIERDRERGNTFLKILWCAVGMLLLHAALKWFGTLNNPPNGR